MTTHKRCYNKNMSEVQNTQEEEKEVFTQSDYKPDSVEEKLLKKWTGRFDRAERFRKPYQAKMLRMYKLYRAYRDKQNYAYNTRIMPPIGFEIVETIKPRLSAARLKTRVFPIAQDDVGSTALEEWDSLLNYNFEVMDLNEWKVDWVDSMLKYGNGYAHIFWLESEEGGDPGMDIIDNWLLYFDPSAGPRLKDSDWEVKQSFKKIAKIKKEEKKRTKNDDAITDDDEELEEGEERETGALYNDNLKYVENQTVAEDPRAERYEIETLKMGQIDDGSRESDDTQQTQSDEKAKEKTVEIWECFDHVEEKIITIMNKEVVVRNEEDPYKDINDGRLIVDLPCIRLPWSAFAMAIMEPVETIIHEIADSRNQAMDDIVYNLDPIRKVKKSANITSDDIPMAPGATWELNNVDDVVIERGVGLDSSWIEKDNVLRGEIQSSLALSEYVRGLPSSPQEPSSKVELLLQQTNIRFSQMVRQMEVAMTDIVTILIEMNKEFLTEGKAYRLLGDDVDFKELTAENKEVKIDARVEIEPEIEKGPEQKKKEANELYEMFITNDAPAEGATEDEIAKFKVRKREMQKLVLAEYDKSQYEEVLLGLEKLEDAEQEEGQEVDVEVEDIEQTVAPVQEATQIPLLEAEATPQSAQPADPKQGLLRKILGGLGR